jgi:molecular chaperone DnaK
MVNLIKSQLEEIIRKQDVKLGIGLKDEITSLYVGITLIYQLINFIRRHNQDFDNYGWRDRNRARTLINQGLQKIGENPNSDDLHPIVISLIDLL